MRVVKQKYASSCGIACVAMVANKSHAAVLKRAVEQDVFNKGQKKGLYTEDNELIEILKSFGIKTGEELISFKKWNEIPDLCICAVNYRKKDKVFHWVVFDRKNGKEKIYDPRRELKKNIRTNFNCIRPEWYLKVENNHE